MKAKARYLDKEIEFEGTVVDGNTIIPHSVLQELAYENGVEYHYDCLFNNGWNAVFMCTATFTDKNGKDHKAQSVGEANSKNLTNDIARMYPNAMASKRAFDRAVIRLFGFKDTYSDSEDVQSPKSKKAAQVASETSVYPDSPIIDFSDVEEEKPAAITEDPADDTEEPDKEAKERPITEPIKNVALPANATPFEVVSADDEYDDEFDSADNSELFAAPAKTEPSGKTSIKVAPKAAPAPESETSTYPAFLDTVVAVGPYNKKGITVNQLYDEDKDALQWIADSRIKGKLFEQQREAAIRTIEYRKGA